MVRSAIIFGNGLGMAVDSQYFQLAEGLSSAWNATDTFTSDHKRLIACAIPGVDDVNFPQQEDQLDKMQMALVALNFLKSLEKNNVEWLSGNSRELPTAFRRFVHAVGMYFHASNHALPLNFVDSLSTYLSQTKSHVGVLNYDNLLYDALTGTNLLAGFTKGSLIDGFTAHGFSPTNLERFYPSRLGWYMHLHGSPLFIGNKKVMGQARAFLEATDECHIVLTHVRHKPSIISSSPILSEYWERLSIALDEAGCVILFGYAGDDVHLNDRIKISAAGKNIHVIEWQGADNQPNRETYWQSRFPAFKIILHRQGNILDFRDWATLA